MTTLLESFRAWLRASPYAPRTQATYLPIIEEFISKNGSALPAFEDVERFLQNQRQDGLVRSSTGWNQRLAALRLLATHAKQHRYWNEDPTESFDFRRAPARRVSVLSFEELTTLFDALASEAVEPRRSRDIAIIALLFVLGLRVSELTGLDKKQLDEPSATLVGVKGKGGTLHDLPLSLSAISLVKRWLEARARWKSGGEALFTNAKGERLTTRSVQRLLVRCRQLLGTAKQLTPHTLRHSSATLALASGVDLVTVSELLRHKSLQVTRSYIHLLDGKRREAVEQLSQVLPTQGPDSSGEPLVPPSQQGAVPVSRQAAPKTSPIRLDAKANLGDAES